MADNTNIKGPKDQTQINIHQPYEVAYWTKTLGVTAEKLKEAVNAVGTSVAAVRAYLQRNR